MSDFVKVDSVTEMGIAAESDTSAEMDSVKVMNTVKEMDIAAKIGDFTKMDAVLSDWKLCLTKQQKEQFSDYHALLCEWNSFMNLTAITEWNEAVVKHYCDSLSIYTLSWFQCQIEKGSPFSMIDVGTGAGFPAIPLKIVFPELKITLVDSLNKRIKFLGEVIERLSLNDIKAIHGRAEELGRNPKYREQYDLCVSRAVANLSTLSEYCIPFVKIGGRFISYKAGNCQQEIESAKRAIDKLSGILIQSHEFVIPYSDFSRTFVEIEKRKATNKAYPRSAGKPSKEPL